WAGARAMTSTSGPGISLMAEFAGLAYFAEVPAVVWDIQRIGPSTGLPTRTGQGDILSTFVLSHGDTKHILLIPATVEECFRFAQEAFNLAEKFQTIVFCMGDLDLGSGHNEAAEYTERPEEYVKLMDRLAKKFETARRFVPRPVIESGPDARIGIVAYGSTHHAIGECRDQLREEQGIETGYLRL